MRCIDCQFIVTQGQPARHGLCWKDKPADRKPKKIHDERKCATYALGAMHQVQARPGWVAA